MRWVGRRGRRPLRMRSKKRGGLCGRTEASAPTQSGKARVGGGAHGPRPTRALCADGGRGRTPPIRSVARSAVRRADVGIGPYGWVFFTLLKSLAEFASADAKNLNHFSPRHVRGEKFLSGCKCGILSPAAKLCAQQTASLLAEKSKIFRQVCLMCYPFWRGGGGEGSGGLCRQRAAGGKDSRGPLWAWRWPSAPARPPDPGQSPTSAG